MYSLKSITKQVNRLFHGKKLDRQLFNAVYIDDLSSVKSAIANGADVNAKDSCGSSVLQTAIGKNIKIIECLLEAGANPNIQGSAGETTLHYAVSFANADKVRLLLKYKADMYIKNKKGQTPFNISLFDGRYNIAKLFISAGYVPSKKDIQEIKNHKLFESIKRSDFTAVKAAIAAGADVNAKDNDGHPLLLKIDFINIEILRYLLENGMNPNMKDNYEWSLLHKFASEGKIDSIKLLLEYKADMTLKDQWGDTPFGEAITVKYDIAELFVLNGYVPSESEFNLIKDEVTDEVTRESLMNLVTQVQKHKESLREDVKVASQEFAYADEVMEI